MSAGVPFSTLITQVQTRANTDAQVNLVTLPMIRDFLNEGLTEFHDLLVEARGQEHCRKTQNFSTVANQSGYPLAADFYELISIDLQLAPQQFLSLISYEEYERNYFRLYPAYIGSYISEPFYYRIQGSPGDQNVVGPITEKVVNFIPSPQGNYPIGVNYIWKYPTFDTAGSQDTNLVNGVNGWELYAVWWAVAACKLRLKEDASFAEGRMAQLKERIQSLAPQNDAGIAARIRDVEADYSSMSWWRS